MSTGREKREGYMTYIHFLRGMFLNLIKSTGKRLNFETACLCVQNWEFVSKIYK